MSLLGSSPCFGVCQRHQALVMPTSDTAVHPRKLSERKEGKLQAEKVTQAAPQLSWLNDISLVLLSGPCKRTSAPSRWDTDAHKGKGPLENRYKRSFHTQTQSWQNLMQDSNGREKGRAHTGKPAAHICSTAAWKWSQWECSENSQDSERKTSF